MSSCIEADVRTLFDSVAAMFASILNNQAELQRIWARGRQVSYHWSLALHLSANDFKLLNKIIATLKPVREVTKAVSASGA